MQVNMNNWEILTEKVKELADGLPIYWGSGNPIDHPHVTASSKDSWSGEGMGYNVFIRREGAGYMKPCEYHSVSMSDI